jgi:diacylglycerol kinase family enzyme
MVADVPGIGVITNPRSKANKRDPSKMTRLAFLLGSRGEAQATRSLDDLHRVAEAFKAAQIDILGINGGDGTIHVTLTAFLKVYGDAPFPKVAILRGGTLNTIAKSLGIRGDTQEILYEIIDRYHAGETFRTIERPVLRIGDQFGFIFGNGLVSNFLEAYYGTGAPSPAVAAKLLFRGIGSLIVGGPLSKRLFRRFNGRVTVDGEEWARRDYTAVAASTISEIGLGFKPFYRCTEKPGHFALLGIHTSALGFALELGRIHRGKPMKRHKTIDAIAREVLLESDEEFGFTIDGDIHKVNGSLTLTTGPTLSMIIPEGIGVERPRLLPAHFEEAADA